MKKGKGGGTTRRGKTAAGGEKDLSARGKEEMMEMLVKERAKVLRLKQQKRDRKKEKKANWIARIFLELLINPLWGIAKGFLRLIFLLIFCQIFLLIAVRFFIPSTEDQFKAIYIENRKTMATMCDNSKSFDLGFCGTFKHVLDNWALNDTEHGTCPVVSVEPPPIELAVQQTLPSPSGQGQLIEWLQLTAQTIEEVRKDLVPLADEFEKTKYEIFDSFEVFSYSAHDMEIEDEKLEDYLEVLKENKPAQEIQSLSPKGIRTTGVKHVYALYYGFKEETKGEKEVGQLFYYRDSRSGKHNFFFAAARLQFQIKPHKGSFFSNVYRALADENADLSWKMSRVNGMDAFLRLQFYEQFQSAGYLRALGSLPTKTEPAVANTTGTANIVLEG